MSADSNINQEVMQVASCMGKDLIVDVIIYKLVGDNFVPQKARF